MTEKKLKLENGTEINCSLNVKDPIRGRESPEPQVFGIDVIKELK